MPRSLISTRGATLSSKVNSARPADTTQVEIVGIRSKLRRFCAVKGRPPMQKEFGKGGLPSLDVCSELLECEPTPRAVFAALMLARFRQDAQAELEAHHTRWPSEDYVDGDELEPEFIYLMIFGKESMADVYAAIGMDPPPRPQGE